MQVSLARDWSKASIGVIRIFFPCISCIIVQRLHFRESVSLMSYEDRSTLNKLIRLVSIHKTSFFSVISELIASVVQEHGPCFFFLSFFLETSVSNLGSIERIFCKIFVVITNIRMKIFDHLRVYSIYNLLRSTSAIIQIASVLLARWGMEN